MPGSPPELRRSRPLSNRPSGAWGAELALRYLTRRGYVLIERNYRTCYGELDLLLRQGNTIVFVEVKRPREPALSIPRGHHPRKQASIRSLAQRYLLDRGLTFDELRFEVVGILVGKDGPRIVYIEDAF